MSETASLDRYNQLLCKCSGVGIRLDISRMRFDAGYLRQMEPAMQSAFAAMAELEAGTIANPDEQRRVGHYWLRAPELAPDGLGAQITACRQRVEAFAHAVHKKETQPPSANRFTDVLLIGIGGSALGPQLLSDALSGLGGKRPPLAMHFFDNTDPDGIARVLKGLGSKLKSTLVLVISKSGGTPETRNGMLEVRRAFENAGLDFAKQAVAITGEGSTLDRLAQEEGWLERFPMWDWVGGRTSVMAAVGLLPAALQGIKVQDLLDGATRMDALTRQPVTKRNPAALLALMWYYAGDGEGRRDMVVLPYKDRLLLFSRYLQQLVMESLGKGRDLSGQAVEQGIAVYGNKGSTDQHAYVQQLREGLNNFFVTFIAVLQDHTRASEPIMEVESGVSSGDYLYGFWLGTRQALSENGRESLSIICDKLDARTLGALIALYERAVGLYASLVHVNAYHQPGVEAGKQAAADALALQRAAIEHLRANPEVVLGPAELAAALGKPEQAETVAHLCEHLAANKRYVVKRGRGFAFKA